ncbi:MAG: PIG-L family deacetylase [Akkermansiaceae bacterium]|nr:PIG-L family deacetylase [Verrucomicrobiales bacterium]
MNTRTSHYVKPDWTVDLFTPGEAPPLAIVVAHPDDEVVGVGAQLRRWPHAHIVHVTDGAPHNSNDAWRAGFVTGEEYASARQRESISALTFAGIGISQLHSLGFTDQETPLHLVSITESLVDKFLELQPQFVITHPYEGGHPDHDSTAFAVHAARDILLREQGVAPVILEATSYFNRSGIMATSEFLPRARSSVKTLVLSADEIEFKQRLFARFKSQQNFLQYFSIRVERLRAAPSYDFTKRPHSGPLYYEQFQRGTTGEGWSKQAAAAARRLHQDSISVEVIMPALVSSVFRH